MNRRRKTLRVIFEHVFRAVFTLSLMLSLFASNVPYGFFDYAFGYIRDQNVVDVLWRAQNDRTLADSFRVNCAQAAVGFVGSCENSAASNPNGADVTLTLPSLSANDLIVIAYSIGDNDGVDFNMDASASLSGDGYTEVADLFSNDTQDLSLGVYYKIANGSETTATVDGQGGTDASVAAICMVFSGVDTTNPMDVTPTTVQAQLNTMHPNPPSINHNNPAGIWTVAVGASGHALNSNGAGTFYTFPTGYTTNPVDRASNDTSDTSVGMGYRSSGVLDPEDPGTMTHTGTDSTSYAWAGATLALRPSSASAPTVTTGVAGNISPSSATLFGNMVSNGGATITEYGFATSTSATMTTDVSTSTVASSVSGEFNRTLLLNAADTTYYYRAYARNSAGYGFGAIRSLFTGNTTVTRKMRLFQGFSVNFNSGRIILRQR